MMKVKSSRADALINAAVSSCWRRLSVTFELDVAGAAPHQADQVRRHVHMGRQASGWWFGTKS